MKHVLAAVGWFFPENAGAAHGVVCDGRAGRVTAGGTEGRRSHRALRLARFPGGPGRFAPRDQINLAIENAEQRSGRGTEKKRKRGHQRLLSDRSRNMGGGPARCRTPHAPREALSPAARPGLANSFALAPCGNLTRRARSTRCPRSPPRSSASSVVSSCNPTVPTPTSRLGGGQFWPLNPDGPKRIMGGKRGKGSVGRGP